PGCQSCPVSSLCTAFAQGAVERIPVKTPKKPPRDVKVCVAAIVSGDLLLMEHRPKGALLAGMWGLPAVELQEGAAPEMLFSERYALLLPQGRLIGHARHTFTHQRWKMDVLLYELDKPAPAAANLEWVRTQDIDNKPVPKAFGRALDVFRDYYAGGDHHE
ncbi:MAG: NUDIX domain-containing protein, partial [Bacillota bacterium]